MGQRRQAERDQHGRAVLIDADVAERALVGGHDLLDPLHDLLRARERGRVDELRQVDEQHADPPQLGEEAALSGREAGRDGERDVATERLGGGVTQLGADQRSWPPGIADARDPAIAVVTAALTGEALAEQRGDLRRGDHLARVLDPLGDPHRLDRVPDEHELPATAEAADVDERDPAGGDADPQRQLDAVVDRAGVELGLDRQPARDRGRGRIGEAVVRDPHHRQRVAGEFDDVPAVSRGDVDQPAEVVVEPRRDLLDAGRALTGE